MNSTSSCLSFVKVSEWKIKIVPRGFLFPPAPPEIRAERSAVVCLEKEQKWLIWSLIVECSHFRMFFDQHWTSSIWWSKPKLHKKEAPPQLTEARCRPCARGLYAGRPSRLLRCQGWGSAPWKESVGEFCLHNGEKLRRTKLIDVSHLCVVA